MKEATDEQLSSMWTEVVNLLKIQFKNEIDEQFFYADLVDLNDWLRRQYGPRGLTCEEVRLAYNYLSMEELTKADGKILEAFRMLDPKTVGEVLAAYRRLVDNDTEVSKVLSQGLYLPEPPEPTEVEIDRYMGKCVRAAINRVKAGYEYIDWGNALFKWLYDKGHLRPTEDQWHAALKQAQKDVPVQLAEQKELAKRFKDSQILGDVIGKRLAAVMNREGDYVKRVRSQAWQICLENFLKEKAGPIAEKPAPPQEPMQVMSSPQTINLPPTQPFSHHAWIENLKADLPKMDDETVSNLQLEARRRNVLDVYELATAEWEKRTAKNPKLLKKSGKK